MHLISAPRKPPISLMSTQGVCGRDVHYWTPPAQIRASPIRALGSYLGCLTATRTRVVRTLRTRSSACDTLPRFCARRVLCWLALPSVPVLGSTGSAADLSALFVGFAATTTESDFSGSCIIGYDSSSSRCGPAACAAGQTRDLPVPAQRASAHARFFDHAGLSERSQLSRPPCCLP